MGFQFFDDHVDLFFTGIMPVVESIRQWFLIVTCSILIFLCAKAVRRIYLTQREITQDSLLITLEATKVVLYFVYEFFSSHLVVLLVVFLIQSSLRAVVCANFFVKALIITKKDSRVLLFQRLYYSVVGGFYVVMIVLALVSKTRIDCSTTMFSKDLVH